MPCVMKNQKCDKCRAGFFHIDYTVYSYAESQLLRCTSNKHHMGTMWTRQQRVFYLQFTVSFCSAIRKYSAVPYFYGFCNTCVVRDTYSDHLECFKVMIDHIEHFLQNNKNLGKKYENFLLRYKLLIFLLKLISRSTSICAFEIHFLLATMMRWWKYVIFKYFLETFPHIFVCICKTNKDVEVYVPFGFLYKKCSKKV